MSKVADGLLLGREPVLWLEALRAILPVAVLFGLPLTPEQTAGLLLAWGAILALITRSAVTPNGSVAERVVDGKVVAGPANFSRAGWMPWRSWTGWSPVSMRSSLESCRTNRSSPRTCR